MIKFLRLLEKSKIINQKRAICEIMTDGDYIFLFRPINFAKLQVEYSTTKSPNMQRHHYIFAKIADDICFKINIA